ncbi:MAG: hypothetical protein K2O58_02255 [Bacteroidales bacterium]|nr:hypothetical protein [Bacteroidales bacterium]
MCSENGVVIGNYVPKEEDSEGDMRLFSARLELAGGFVPLLKVIECIEEHPGGVRIVSASFRRLRDGKAGYTVTLDLWLMQLEERI